MTNKYKIDTEYWARYFKALNNNPDLTFVIKYNYDGAQYTNVSDKTLDAPVQFSVHQRIKPQESFLTSGHTFERVLYSNRERYKRISEETYVKALISGQLYDD